MFDLKSDDDDAELLSLAGLKYDLNLYIILARYMIKNGDEDHFMFKTSKYQCYAWIVYFLSAIFFVKGYGRNRIKLYRYILCITFLSVCWYVLFVNFPFC